MKNVKRSQKNVNSTDSADKEIPKNPLPENYDSDFPYSDAKEYEKLANEALKVINQFMVNIQSSRDDMTYDFDFFNIDFTEAIDVHDFSSFVGYCNKMTESDTHDKIWDNLSKHDKVLQYIKANTLGNIDEFLISLNEDKSLCNILMGQLNDLKPPLPENYDPDFSCPDFDKKEFKEIADSAYEMIIGYMDDIVYLEPLDFGSGHIYEDAKSLTDSEIHFDSFLKYCKEMTGNDAISGAWSDLSKFNKVFQFTKKIAIENICYTMDAIAKEMSHMNSVKVLTGNFFKLKN